MPVMKSTINPDTRISELIKANPLVIDTLVQLNPNFSKLKNPVLRNLLAKRVSISGACKIAGCNLSEFMGKMIAIGFETEMPTELTPVLTDDNMSPAVFTAGYSVVELDVRPVLAFGGDPLKLILKTSKALKDNECLKIINTFEPIPLINLLCKQGYRFWTERPDKETVCTWFVKEETSRVLPDLPAVETGSMNTGLEFEQMIEFFGSERIRTIDVTGLEMPKPMIKILDSLLDLKEDEALFVYHKKFPVYLLPELQDRGFRYFIEKRPAGKVNMLICKK